ncbi:MAG: hypothetical protein J6R88_03560 [Clostridia bacterium]|nr:hypothetical protein [Clostridia bacterium]
MDEILLVVSNVAFIFFIIASVFFGFSLAVQSLITKVIKNVNAESDKNYLKVPEAEREVCNEVISDVAFKLSKLSDEQKRIKQIKSTNKIRKFFRLSEIPVEETTVTVKDVAATVLDGVAVAFYGTTENKPHLNFSEREIFKILTTLKNRVKDVLTATNVIWLKELPISFFVICYNVYGMVDKIKNKPLVLLLVKIIDFCLWFSRILSPVGIGKYLVNDLSKDGLNGVINSTISSVIVKELAVIYYEKNN